jgi:hypothetical protein
VCADLHTRAKPNKKQTTNAAASTHHALAGQPEVGLGQRVVDGGGDGALDLGADALDRLDAAVVLAGGGSGRALWAAAAGGARARRSRSRAVGEAHARTQLQPRACCHGLYSSCSLDATNDARDTSEAVWAAHTDMRPNTQKQLTARWTLGTRCAARGAWLDAPL